MLIKTDIPKEVIEFFNRIGVIVNELDEHGNIISFYNLPQWFKNDNNGNTFEVPFIALPDSAKRIHLSCRDYKRVYTEEEMLECFNESRLTHQIIGFKYDTFSDYLKTLNK